MKIIILAGGCGTRLWPFSRKSFPKQFLHFGDEHSLLQKTLIRFLKIAKPEDLLILTNQSYFHLVKKQATEIHPLFEHQILVEPERKNTAPAICLAVSYLQSKGDLSPSETLLISSSDHLITPETPFLETVQQAEKEAKKGRHILFGVRPSKPETGYGYIKIPENTKETLVPVLEFVEKPEYERAQEYVLSGNYLWNTGIFLFQAGLLEEELRSFNPEIDACFHSDFQKTTHSFSHMPDISIDYALMEKSQHILVAPLSIGWSDIGSWDSVYDSLPKDEESNVKMGNIVSVETHNCLILGGKRLISTVGLSNLFIIETEDALLIGKKGESQKVKGLVAALEKFGKKESHEHLTTYRPWGSFTILEEKERYKIKKIVVLPGQRLSLQMHHHRSEHWIVVKGKAKVTIGDETSDLHENESTYISKSKIHRLENPGKIALEMIEVQVGEYLGEDDIVRLSDDYARIS